MNAEIEIRPWRQSDEAFIYSTWLAGHKRGSYDARRIRDSVYYHHHHALIERILSRATTLVACPIGDPDTILGYVVAEPANSPPILHWCFVKLPWRRLRIATRLIETVIPNPNKAVFTHWACWNLAVPAPKGVDRGDRKAIREARLHTIREMEKNGEAGGDTEDLLRHYPGMEYNPYAR